MKIRVQLKEGGYMPTKAHSMDAGFDLFIPDTFIIAPRGSITVDTRVCMEIPRGYVGFIKSKSGLNVKHGLRGEGVIDAGYTGSICVKLYNDSDEEYTFERGDKLTQIVILPIPEVELEETEELACSERGDKGFGSSGR